MTDFDMFALTDSKTLTPKQGIVITSLNITMLAIMLGIIFYFTK